MQAENKLIQFFVLYTLQNNLIIHYAGLTLSNILYGINFNTIWTLIKPVFNKAFVLVIINKANIWYNDFGGFSWNLIYKY